MTKIHFEKVDRHGSPIRIISDPNYRFVGNIAVEAIGRVEDICRRCPVKNACEPSPFLDEGIISITVNAGHQSKLCGLLKTKLVV